MLSDETFPIDFEDDHYTHDTNLNTLASAETSASTSAYSSENTCNISSAKSLGNASSDQNDSHYASFDACASIGKVTLPAPRAPVKKKKSYSCHDLMGSKKNYDHVESKVKKLIEDMNDSYRKGKTLSRHKSMPLTIQLPGLDDTFSQERDCAVLIKELRKKSVKIYELEERCEEKDSRIYSLELEKSKMKMTFDKIRVEMHDLKIKETDYKQKLAVSPPQRMLRNIAVQTEDSQKIHLYAYKNDLSSNPIPSVRELTFNTDSHSYINRSLNQTHFSDLNNDSSDNLIPTSEISLENINLTTTTTGQVIEPEEDEPEPKKTKKFRRLLKLMPCVSK